MEEGKNSMPQSFISFAFKRALSLFPRIDLFAKTENTTLEPNDVQMANPSSIQELLL